MPVPGWTACLRRSWNLCYGSALLLSERGLAFKGCRRRASRLEPIAAAAVLQAMYEDADMLDADRKTVANVTYGLLNRAELRRQTAHLFQTDAGVHEALALRGETGEIFRLSESADVWALVRSRATPLVSGFLPLAHMILDGARVHIHRICAARRREFCRRAIVIVCAPWRRPAARRARRASGFRLAERGSAGSPWGSCNRAAQAPGLPRARRGGAPPTERSLDAARRGAADEVDEAQDELMRGPGARFRQTCPACTHTPQSGAAHWHKMLLVCTNALCLERRPMAAVRAHAAAAGPSRRRAR